MTTGPCCSQAITDGGQVLEAWYPRLGLGPLPDDHRGPYGVPADLVAPPSAVAGVYLLSRRLLNPAQVHLTGMLEVLPLNTWTNAGPCSTEQFEEVRLRLRIAAKGAPVSARAVAKVPPMADYVIPPKVAIANAAHVRLGAYLAPGTKVTNEGFIDAGAAASGAAYIHGRVNRGVIVEEGTHLRARSSILPSQTAQTVRIGRNCLIGANALLRRNSTTGVVEALDRGHCA